MVASGMEVVISLCGIRSLSNGSPIGNNHTPVVIHRRIDLSGDDDVGFYVASDLLCSTVHGNLFALIRTVLWLQEIER